MESATEKTGHRRNQSSRFTRYFSEISDRGRFAPRPIQWKDTKHEWHNGLGTH